MTDSHTPFECGLDTYINLDADIESISLPALRAFAGKHENLLVGLTFDAPMQVDNADIYDDGQFIGTISSHAWSPRYGKHLALAMMKRDYLANHATIRLNDCLGAIVDLPFNLTPDTATG